MSADRYRAAVLPASVDAYGQARTETRTCTDCGALVLDRTTHDTWHTITAATHLHAGDVLILDGDFSTDLEGRQHLNDLLTRLDIAHRTLVIGDGLTAQALPRETLEPANPPCPDCGHDAHHHKGPRTGCKAAVPVAGICGCHRTAW